MLPLAALALCLSPSEVKATVPDQPVEVTLELEGFKSEPAGKAERALLFGKLAKGAAISVLCEENDPFLSARECAERRKGDRFDAGDLCCVVGTETAGPVEITRYHAYAAEPDYLFDIHVSVTRVAADKNPAKFTQADFVAIATSFRVAGRPDRSKFDSPPEYYLFRDEAAKNAADQLGWVTAQCRERADDAWAHLYLARLLRQREKDELAAVEFGVFSDLLAARPSRTEKETSSLIAALYEVGSHHGARKQYARATVPLKKIVDVTASAPRGPGKSWRAQAFYNLAICSAQTQDKKAAVEYLRQAISLTPEMKERAAEDEMLGPLRSEAAFKKLTKS